MYIYVPINQSIIQGSIISPQNEHNVEPSLGKEVTAMVVDDFSTFFHLVLDFIQQLVSAPV